MNQYMEAYADKFNLHQHILLQTTVQHARKREGVNNGWDIHFIDNRRQQQQQHDDEDEDGGAADGYGGNDEDGKGIKDGGRRKSLFCKQLVVAQGFAPTPNIPDNIPCDEFNGIISHTKDVGQYFDQLITPSTTTTLSSNSNDDTNVGTAAATTTTLIDSTDRIAVYGAGKSAFDIIAALASRGKKIVWIIRGEGRGAGWLMSPFADGDKKKVYADTMASKKIFGMVFPCMYQDDGYGWLHALFCRTWLGRRLTRLIFSIAHKEGMKQFGKLPENLKWLEPSVEYVFLSPFLLLREQVIFPQVKGIRNTHIRYI